MAPERRRWFIIGVIFIAIVFNYFDRQIVSILKPAIKGEFQLSDAGYALLINAFTVCYALMYPVSGWLTDRFGPKRVMFYGVIGWSLACIGGGISKTVGQFTFFRALLGLSEPANFPSQLKVVTVWFPGKLRATANSLCVAGSSLGAIMAPPLVAWLALSFNWHAVFFVAGIAGLVIALLWWFIYREPPAHIAKQAAQSAGPSSGVAFSWRQLWKTKSLYGILLIRFISDPVWYFCLFWLPGYLQEESGLSLAQVGMFGWIPFLVADLGAIGTSAWSDWLVKRGRKPFQARRFMLTATAAFAPLCVITPYLSNPFLTIGLFGVIAVVCLSWLFTLPVVGSEVFPMKNVASVMGISGGFGALGAVLFNYFVGQLMGTIGAGKIFLIMALLHPLSVLILWTMVRPEKPRQTTNVPAESTATVSV